MGDAVHGKVNPEIPGIQFCVKQVLDIDASNHGNKDDGNHSATFSYSSAFKPYGTLPLETYINGKELVGSHNTKPSPFSPECSVPLPFRLGEDYGFYAIDSLWKRNERERHRVRCVNEGYERLRNHLPLRNKHKRISKVETLRLAIRYIKYLQDLLANDDSTATMANFEEATSKQPNGR